MTVFVGDDWAEAHHDVHLMNETGDRLASRRFPEGPGGHLSLCTGYQASRVAAGPVGVIPPRMAATTDQGWTRSADGERGREYAPPIQYYLAALGTGVIGDLSLGAGPIGPGPAVSSLDLGSRRA